MTRVLLAGTAGAAAGRHHQRDMFAPAIAASEVLEVSAVWPGSPGSDGYARGADLATALDVPYLPDLDEALDGCDAVVACLDGDGLEALLAAGPAGPVALDKALLLGVDRLADLAADPRANRLVGAYHSRFHPSVSAVASAVRSGELGLPHALHGELLVPFGDGPAAEGDLWHVGVLALDAVAAVFGPPAGGVHAVLTASGDPATETWTLTLRWHPGVVVTLIVSRGQPGVPGMVHRYRVMGSEGQLLADLAAPALTVVGDPVTIGYGPGLVQLELETLARGGIGATMADLTAIARLVEAAEHSAADGQVHALG
jgi:predicted dehydrogenase